MRMIGSFSWCAIISACTILRAIPASAAPPRMVKSSAVATTGRPLISALPNRKGAGVTL
jgi:hypothetical protein